MKKSIYLIAALASFMAPSHWVHAMVAPPSPETAGLTADMTANMTAGEVRKIDVANQKITIRHEEIKNLDMPSMTMVFPLGRKVVMQEIQTGDRIKFRAEKQGGKIVVTEIQKN